MWPEIKRHPMRRRPVLASGIEGAVIKVALCMAERKKARLLNRA
jgi:hypothetical protein